MKKKLTMLLSIMVVGGIIGFIYETIFYRIDLGYFVKRGSTFGPWIPIYGFGSVFIYLIVKRFKNKPFLIFMLSCLISGILEYSTGYVLLHFFNKRLWDYNIEIWNFGNINGFICFRSVLLFGVAGVFLIQFVVPILSALYAKYKKKFSIPSIVLGILFILDLILYIFI